MRSGWEKRYPRPRLAASVSARLHWVDGELVVALHLPSAGSIACLDARSWAVVRAADGSRDLRGILEAARSSAGNIAEAAARDLLDRLYSVGALDNQPSSPPTTTSGARRARTLAGFSLSCDGRGTCCRLYPTITFLPDERAHARSACPELLDGGHHPERVFSPLAGGAAPSWHPRAVAMIDGRCAYLSPDNQCSIHVKAGAARKPRGCRSYPLAVVDDGRELRAGPRPECRCVLLSPPVSNSNPWTDVPDHLPVDRVPATIAVGDGTDWERARFIAWCDDVLERAAGATDGVVLLTELADRIAPTAGTLAEQMTAWSGALDRHVQRHAFRVESDLVRVVPRWMRQALAKHAGAPSLPSESLYLRALTHLRAWATGSLPLAAALRERMLRLRIARAMATCPELAPDDSAADAPLAVVEALAESYGLGPRIELL